MTQPGAPLEEVRPAGSSHEQRAAEVAMLAVLGDELGVELAPQRLRSPVGSVVDVDGVARDHSILVECWAHLGPARGAQKHKLATDALKLHWVSTWLEPKPSRLIICVSDPAAIKHLQGRSWQGASMRSVGIELVSVALDADVLGAVEAAQRRQYR